MSLPLGTVCRETYNCFYCLFVCIGLIYVLQLNQKLMSLAAFFIKTSIKTWLSITRVFIIYESMFSGRTRNSNIFEPVWIVTSPLSAAEGGSHKSCFQLAHLFSLFLGRKDHLASKLTCCRHKLMTYFRLDSDFLWKYLAYACFTFLAQDFLWC